MSANNTYLENFNRIIKQFDIPTKNEITKAIIQSISDLDLESSSFEEISNKLGTPKEYVEEYIKEMNIVSPKSKIKLLDRLELSFVVIKILQILGVIIVPMLLITEIRWNGENIIYSIILYYVILILVFLITHKISQRALASVQNFGEFYYKSFVILSLFIFSNILLDDYVIGLNQYFRVNITFIPFFGFGIFLFWILPITIMSGLKYTMIKENLIIPESHPLGPHLDNQFKKRITDITKVVIALNFFIMYLNRDFTTFYILLIITIVVIHTEYLLVYKSIPDYYKTKLRELVKLSIILGLIYLISYWLDKVIWAGY
ncbi:MAG: hypothetical protein GPJ54_20735 [Candidatus Heimdallarchaeota archaeon]|nr:hypothetical protein [Candidatus Heimdallarchaeota archaeon]